MRVNPACLEKTRKNVSLRHETFETLLQALRHSSGFGSADRVTTGAIHAVYLRHMSGDADNE